MRELKGIGFSVFRVPIDQITEVIFCKTENKISNEDIIKYKGYECIVEDSTIYTYKDRGGIKYITARLITNNVNKFIPE